MTLLQRDACGRKVDASFGLARCRYTITTLLSGAEVGMLADIPVVLPCLRLQFYCREFVEIIRRYSGSDCQLSYVSRGELQI